MQVVKDIYIFTIREKSDNMAKLGFGRYCIMIRGTEPDTILINDGLNANDAIKRALKIYKDTGHKAVIADCEIVEFERIFK